MKRINHLFLSALFLFLCFSLIACNGGNGPEKETEKNPNSQTEAKTENGTEDFDEPRDSCANGHDYIAGADFYTCNNCDFKHATSKGLEYELVDEAEKTCEVVSFPRLPPREPFFAPFSHFLKTPCKSTQNMV